MLIQLQDRQNGKDGGQMTKKHFIELADVIRQTKPKDPEPDGRISSILIGELAQWEHMKDALADFCQEFDPRFNRKRWLDYIAGTCGPNGGSVKKGVSK